MCHDESYVRRRQVWVHLHRTIGDGRQLLRETCQDGHGRALYQSSVEEKIKWREEGSVKGNMIGGDGLATWPDANLNSSLSLK